jgi:hypothetical protein
MTTVLDTNTKLENTKEEPLSSLLCRVKVSEKVGIYKVRDTLNMLRWKGGDPLLFLYALVKDNNWFCTTGK